MESLKPEMPSAGATPANRVTMAVRCDKPILELPKLVPVTDPKPSMESPQQSMLRKSVTTSTTAAGGQPNLVKLVQKTIPIRTIQGPNGNLIVQGPKNKILSLQIKGTSIASPQLVPINFPNENKTAMLKVSGVTSFQTHKLVPKETSTTKASASKHLFSNLKHSKDIMMTSKTTSKQSTSLVKFTTQDTQTLFKVPSKEPPPASKLSPNITSSLPTATSQVINTLVSSKALEIKPITVTDSPKALTPAQAATVPITQITPTNLLTKLCTTKADTGDLDTVTIEKKTVKKLQPTKLVPSRKDYGSNVVFTPTSTSGNKMISLQISNGRLSDPNGPIKLISANNPVTKVQPEKLVDKPNSDKTESPALDSPPLPHKEEVEKSQSSASSIPQQTTEQSAPEEESALQNKQIKRKQQSLLRNKTIEDLQRSPRTKCRSKSLTVFRNKLKRQKRRLSTASDSDIKKVNRVKLNTASSLTINKTPPENQVNKLLCPEKISTSSDSLGSTSPIEEKVASVPINFAPTEIIEMNSSDDDDKTAIEERINRSSPPTKVGENEIYSCLNWHDGVGSLKESSLQFQFNEFGLIEILESAPIKTELDCHYEKPIFEREVKSQKTLDYSNPYFCKGCNCKGAAVDFLTPEFCSRECIRKYNRRLGGNVSNFKTTKKYTNRKKCIIPMEDLDSDPLEIKSDLSLLLKPSKFFSWETYLNASKGKPTPIELFLNPFPCSSNMFQVGMKLEAIDPEHSSMFCVCTIVEKKGYRLKLNFDGYSKYYDFWVNADSMDIFPPGWCAKTNRTLQPPRGTSPLSFNWPKYLTQTKALPAPRNLFTHLNSSSQTHGYKVGMKIEADDLRNSGKVCVATIADILDNRLLILFDGWDDSYSYWIDINSPYIHPVNWHKKNGFSIVPPPEYEERFSWGAYLAETGAEPATEDLFKTRDPVDFKPGYKLEVVDKRNPALIRPASVVMTDDYEIKVLFEGWPMEYAFWIEDDSPDIHPIGWCEITNHELEPPPEYDSLPSRYDCKFPGCRGIGNALHPELDYHTNILSCPYETANWSKEIDKTGRLNNFNRYDTSAMLNKPKEIIPRNKRKADTSPRPHIIAKLPKHQMQVQHSLLQQASLQVTGSTGMSLLANKSNKSETNIDTINIARHLLCDYGPRLQQVYPLWKQNSECLAVNLSENKDHSKNPLEWSVDDVAEYISKLPRCQAIAQEFIKQDIDGSAFLSMRQSDLTEFMKIKLGPAIKIYNQIVQLREEVVTRFMTGSSRVS